VAMEQIKTGGYLTAADGYPEAPTSSISQSSSG
jgi:hypothetical protein